MKILGVSAGHHDAAVAIIDSETRRMDFAAHSERYSRVKNDPQISFLLNHVLNFRPTEKSVFYEKTLHKNFRRLWHHQKYKPQEIRTDESVSHHWSHAAASYYTRPWRNEPVCVVIDAIGEWDTATIWYKKKRVWRMKYPKSLGLFYSAVTDYLGYTPNLDEHIVMAKAAYGEPIHADIMRESIQMNCHRGLPDFPELLWTDLGGNVAASAQLVLEEEILKIMKIARGYSEYLCYGGGVALNCVANSNVLPKVFDIDKVWIMPNPGDAGASLGAAAAYIDKRIKWEGPYLGHDIEQTINPRLVAEHISVEHICGVANGPAEFGPRALGNRSLLCDPTLDIKERVDRIKKRDRWRPYGAAILEEEFDNYFEGPKNEYMQYTTKVKSPDDFRAICHIDGTSRVQSVGPNCKSVIRPILEEWFKISGCPMLLNTSLNIKGSPLVNSIIDKEEFELERNVKVF